MDSAEPPRIVFAQPAPCSDAARAEELLRHTLAPSRAPRAAWTVGLRVERELGGMRAEGEITDEAGAPVAHRVFTRATSECAALARAVGVWASLVLDAELEKARAAPPVAPPAPAAVADSPLVPWPAPAPHEKPSPEAYTLLKHEDGRRSLEVGVASFLMGGTGTGVLAGPELFTVFEVGSGVFLRPMIAFGRTLQALKPSGDVYGTWGAGRFDACVRVPGLYMDRRGLQLDLCGGTDIGFLHFDQNSTYGSSFVDNTPPQSAARTLPFLAVGPSLGMRGELASDLSVEVRGVVGLNVIRESFYDPSFGARVDPPLFNARAELALSWRVR